MGKTDTITMVLMSACVASATTLAILAHHTADKLEKLVTPQPRTQIIADLDLKPKQHIRILSAKVTAYCPCEKCCGASADGVTSRGRDAYKTRGVAVDPKRIKYGSMIEIPGAGTFVADDTGGAMRNAKGHHIDLRFPTHQEALNWGVKNLIITVTEKL